MMGCVLGNFKAFILISNKHTLVEKKVKRLLLYPYQNERNTPQVLSHKLFMTHPLFLCWSKTRTATMKTEFITFSCNK